MGIRKFWKLLKEAFTSWADDYAPSMGAALSYYTMFSIAPLLLIVISVAGIFFGADAVRGAVFGQLAGLMGDEGARAVQDMLARVSDPETGGAASIAGVLALILGATTVFNELQNGMDRIWRAPVKNKPSGIWGMVRTRLLSFGMILGLAFLLAVSLMASAAVSALGKWWGGWFGAWEALAHVIDLVVSFGLLTLIFAAIYKVMPRVKVRWRDVWVGAGFTALLFTLGKFLIGLYLGKSDVATGFGAAGSLVLVMVWVYYSAQIFYLGAEFTRVYAHAFGSRRAQAEAPAAKDVQGGVPASKEIGVPASKEIGVPASAATDDVHNPDVVTMPAREAANSVLEPAAAPAAPMSAARKAILMRRAAAERSLASAPHDIEIRNGRMMIDPVGRGLEARAAARQRHARNLLTRPAAPLALGIAAVVGLVVGAVYRFRGMRRNGVQHA
jgi:membrane protein